MLQTRWWVVYQIQYIHYALYSCTVYIVATNKMVGGVPDTIYTLCTLLMYCIYIVATNKMVGGVLDDLDSRSNTPSPQHTAIQLEDTLGENPHRYVRVSYLYFLRR